MLPSKPDFETRASLHFLPSGDFLFVDHEQGERAKFLSMAAVQAAFNTQGRDTGWMPAGLVRHGQAVDGAWYVYSAPAQKVDIQVLDETLCVPAPRTVLVHYNRKVWMFAVISSSFEPLARVFAAPFPNIHADGKVCWGSNTAPVCNAMQARKTWEQFFATAFNLDLSNDKCKSHPKNVVELLRTLNGKGKFPHNELVPSSSRHSTIGALVDALVGKKEE